VLGPSTRVNRLIRLIVTASLALAIPLAAQAHGRNAVPSDPELLARYKTGLSAYLNRDYATALKEWRPLAERKSENSAAQLFLGFMHGAGQGVPRDPAAAAEWYRRSAQQNNMLAQLRLGFIYRRGEGVPQDLVQAYLWASLAAQQESHLKEVAQTLQEALTADMTPEQISEATRLAGQRADDH
jgi:TPR repeat protein